MPDTRSVITERRDPIARARLLARLERIRARLTPQHQQNAPEATGALEKELHYVR